MPNDFKQAGQRGLGQGANVSDLIGVTLTLGLALWFLVVLACFFIVGPVAGDCDHRRGRALRMMRACG